MSDPLAFDPHKTGELVRSGPTAASARRAAVVLHGRYGAPQDIVGFVQGTGLVDVALFAPTAAGRSWWPTSFLAPICAMEPFVQSALQAVERALRCAEDEGFDPADTVLLGFSQGGCLALEAAARGFGAGPVVSISAGLVGTADAPGGPSDELYGYTPKRFDYVTSLAGRAVHIGCHAADPVIPLARVTHSAAVIEALGADVSLAIEPGAHHGASPRDVNAVRTFLGL